jgi:o-succinylbenzoate---CoA ligase
VPYVPASTINPCDWLSRSAATAPERIALIAEGRRTTFAELEREAAVTAERMELRAGERFAFTPHQSREDVVLLHALMKAGAVAVPLDPRLPPEEIERRAERAGDARERETGLDAVHSVIHTSGTAGVPKAVELTYANHLWSALGSGARIGVDPSDRWLCCLPLHHVGGLAIVLRSAIYGTAVVLERFEAERIAALITAEQITLASLVGTTLARLLDAGAELDRLRCALVGGGPAGEGVLERALDAGVQVAPTYGLTEAASQVTTLPPGEASRRPGSAGTPLLPTEVRVEDEQILVRGPTVAPGAVAPDGWLHTGDRGRIDAGGHLYVLGRADDVIVSGGENVVPEEVERVLMDHHAVADAAVVGEASTEWQEAVIATVVLREGAGASEGELRDFCRARLAPFQVPKQVRFAEELPRDAQGKLRRTELR